MSLSGSDVSEFQQVGSAPRAGESFWFVRLRDGTHIDRSYTQHVAVALGHRLPFIAPYLFYRSSLDPIEQANWLGAAVMADRRLMTGAVDIEEISFDSDRLSKTARETRIDRFIGRYEQIVKRRLILYTTPNTAETLVRFANIPGARRVITWQAEWGPALHPIPYLPAPSFWQTADHGGAGGGDADVCLHDRAFLESLTRPLVVAPISGRKVFGPWKEKPHVTFPSGYHLLPLTPRLHPADYAAGYRWIGVDVRIRAA